MPRVQAILFDRKYFTATKARKWLKEHDYKPIKRVDRTKNFLRYRIRSPFDNFYTKKIKNDTIHLVIGD